MLRATSISLFLAAVLSGQRASPPATFHTGTQLVQVSVVAQDSAGKAVADLRREDFQVFDNGAPQEIRLFLAENFSAGPAEAEQPGTFSNRLSAGNGGGGYSVLLFDNVNVDSSGKVFAHTARARQKALQALQSIPEGDKIAVYSLWCKFQVIREFTSDRDSLLQQLEAFAPSAAPCLDPSSGAGPSRMSTAELMISGPVRADGTPGVGSLNMPPPPSEGHAAEGMAAAAAGVAADISDREMQQMAEHLAGIPGRKNLIWLTTTFRISPPNLRRLIEANVAIYPVDTLGSTIALKVAKDEHAAPLRALAAQTGGVAYVDRDDLDAAIHEALYDGHISYTLGYYQPDAPKDPPVHQIRIRVGRPGVTLRYRTSYAVSPEQPAPADPVRAMVQALNRPVNATEIPITASLTRQEDRIDLSATFDISGLDLQLSDDLWKGKAEVVSRFMTADGIQAGNTTAETMIFTLKPATYTSMLQNGAVYHRQIEIPPQAVELDLLVGSLSTGKIGTLKIPLSQVSSSPAETAH